MARLVCIRGELEGSSFDIERGLTLGRAPHNGIALGATRGVSRDHAKVWQVGARQYAVANLGSTNGTLVNDARQERAQLQDGDTLQIGDAVFRFELDASEQPKAPAAPAAAAGRAEASSLFGVPAAGGEGPAAAAPAAPVKLC